MEKPPPARSWPACSNHRGKIFFRGKESGTTRTRKDFKEYQLGVQLIHQDPYASLNPSHTIQRILSAPLTRHNMVPGRATNTIGWLS